MGRGSQSTDQEVRGGKVKRRPLLESEQTELEDFCRLFLVNAIHDYCYLMGITYALHGGAALVMFGAVPRKTFDIDMLVDRPDLLAQGVDVIAGVVEDNFRDMGVEAEITLRSTGASDSSILRWKLSCALANVIGSAHAKMEFWAAARDYIIRQIDTGTFVSATMNQSADGVNSVGRLSPLMSKPLQLVGNTGLINDKLVAIVSRPYTKWCDFFDLAYLIHAANSDLQKRCVEKFIGHASIYEGPSSASMVSKIDEILSIPDEEMAQMIRSGAEYVPSERGLVVFDHDDVMTAAPARIKGWLDALKQHLLNKSIGLDAAEQESKL